MNRNILLWILAFFITVFTAAYQRITGPTYPISGEVLLSDNKITYKFDRSHGGYGDHEVSLNIFDPSIKGILFYKRYKTDDEWSKLPMFLSNDTLSAYLPNQPPAGKLEYYIELSSESEQISIPGNESVVIRFKGDVPMLILIPHIIAMFMSMMLSNRTGLELFNRGKNTKKLTYWTIGTLIIGGFILGPLTQLYAFGELWTGIPFGHDLTDNKTLIALVGWLLALFMYNKSKYPSRWALFASLLLLLVYLIPHSLLGSELDYKKIDADTTKVEKMIQ